VKEKNIHSKINRTVGGGEGEIINGIWEGGLTQEK
jgi:hypothetical protein